MIMPPESRTMLSACIRQDVEATMAKHPPTNWANVFSQSAPASTYPPNPDTDPIWRDWQDKPECHTARILRLGLHRGPDAFAAHVMAHGERVRKAYRLPGLE